MRKDVLTRTEEETMAFAAELAAGLAPGALLLLHGGLGAGKTAFVRGLARGLGADENEVSSPTFALMQRYEGRLPLFHFDLYRLADEDEVLSVGFDEIFFGAQGVCAVEWPQRAQALFADAPHLAVSLAPSQDENERRITLTEENGYALSMP